MARRSANTASGIRHADIAAQSLAAPGQWIRVNTYNSLTSAKNIVRDIEAGTPECYAPAGTFEARYELGESDYDVYVRC